MKNNREAFKSNYSSLRISKGKEDYSLYLQTIFFFLLICTEHPHVTTYLIPFLSCHLIIEWMTLVG